MAHVIEFRSTTFDSTAEPENPFNPIKGHTLGVWLQTELEKRGVPSSKVEPEDWGWYSEVVHLGRTYLLGFIEYDEDDQFAIQVERHRSLMEKLRGRGRMAPTDELSGLIQAILRESKRCTDIDIQTGG